VQGQHERIQGAAATQPRHILINRKVRALDFRPDIALPAQVFDIGRQSIANINHGCCEVLLS
jgi:hypothetical protein